MKTPYDALLRLRRRELDECRLQLASAEDSERAARERVSSMEKHSAREAGAACGMATIDFTGFRRRLTTRVAEATAECHKAEAQVDSARRLSIEAFIGKKTVELAAERYIEQVSEHQARVEQARLDEIAARPRSR